MNDRGAHGIVGDAKQESSGARGHPDYQALGMRPLHVRKEVPGFVADRLLEALWREALHLVNDGVATTGEIDDAIRFGAGLRWSFMGSFLTYTLAGGDAGMRHFMTQFGPALELPWSYLKAPELTESLIDSVVEGTGEQQGNAALPSSSASATTACWPCSMRSTRPRRNMVSLSMNEYASSTVEQSSAREGLHQPGFVKGHTSACSAPIAPPSRPSGSITTITCVTPSTC